MVSSMEKHYVFKSLFEDNITQVSSIGGKASKTLNCMCHSAHIFQCSYCSMGTRRLLIDNGCSSPEFCNPVQYCLACRNLYILPDSKISSKNTLHHSSGIIVFKKRSRTKRSMLFRPTLHYWRLQTALPSDVCFTAPPTKMSAWR